MPDRQPSPHLSARSPTRTRDRLRFDGKRALITGAASGFGARFAEVLAAAFAAIALPDIVINNVGIGSEGSAISLIEAQWDVDAPLRPGGSARDPTSCRAHTGLNPDSSPAAVWLDACPPAAGCANIARPPAG